jgi:hypothetical protein
VSPRRTRSLIAGKAAVPIAADDGPTVITFKMGPRELRPVSHVPGTAEVEGTRPTTSMLPTSQYEG